MKKNGFTFVEILIVMALFGLICLVVIPSFTSLIKNANENRKKAFENDIFLATEAYIQRNSELYPELNEIGGSITITLEQLFIGNFVKSTLVNPYYCDNDVCTSKKISNCDEEGNCIIDNYRIVVSTNEDKTYSFRLIEP